MKRHISNAIADQKRFAATDADGLVKQVQALVRHSLHDEYNGQFRRLMTIKQYRSPELSALYTARYVERLVTYHEKRRRSQHGLAVHLPNFDLVVDLRPATGKENTGNGADRGTHPPVFDSNQTAKIGKIDDGRWRLG
ncbi:MAG: hypothetical protein LKJ86_01385 [Oscillibacter sp.]|jgi:hypothetical protein|nr:hypothetical protein [Oscillibacter sp.]